MKMQKGMTLIELMVVVVIIAILVGIAYPSYTKQVQKTRRADCQGALMGLANAMERYFTENNTYTGATLTGANAIYPGNCPLDGGTAMYTLSLGTPTATTYTLTATPTGPQVSDECGTLSLDQTGRKGASGVPAAQVLTRCWR